MKEHEAGRNSLAFTGGDWVSGLGEDRSDFRMKMETSMMPPFMAFPLCCIAMPFTEMSFSIRIN